MDSEIVKLSRFKYLGNALQIRFINVVVENVLIFFRSTFGTTSVRRIVSERIAILGASERTGINTGLLTRINVDNACYIVFLSIGPFS